MNKRDQKLSEKDWIIRVRKDSNSGLGNIFRQLRTKDELEGLGDYTLYKRIILTLAAAGYKTPRQSIVRHFASCVSKDDYDPSEKEALLKDLRIASEAK